MAGRNGSLTPVNVYLPTPLVLLVRQWQNATLLPSFSQAIQRLVETHPDIDRMIRDVYSKNSQQENPERTPA